MENRYTNLDYAPLKVMAQLRGLSADGDKETLVRRLCAQDSKTAKTAEPHDIMWECATDDTVPKEDELDGASIDGAPWEVVSKKPSKHTAVNTASRILKNAGYTQDASDAEDMKPVVIGHKEATMLVPMPTEPTSVGAKLTEAIQNASIAQILESLPEVELPVGKVTKKKSRRGKKGGKKANKNKVAEDNDATGKETDKALVEPEVTGDSIEYQHAPAIIKEASSAATTVVENYGAIYDETLSGVVEHEMAQSIVTGDVETACSTAPTVVEESTPGMEKISGVENIQTPSSQELKLQQPMKRAYNVNVSSNKFGLLDAQDLDDEESTAVSERLNSVGSVPKKSRKRGKKGGKKARKSAAKTTQPKRPTYVTCAAVFVGVVGVVMGMLVKFA